MENVGNLLGAKVIVVANKNTLPLTVRFGLADYSLEEFSSSADHACPQVAVLFEVIVG